jgi:glycosyltransferase involved in cell wall biosynthesis
MNVHAYVHLSRTYHARTQTGVGKHIDQMVPRLARANGFNVTVLGDRADMTPDGRIPPESSLHGMPAVALPGRRWLEIAWAFLDAPKVEHWAGRADWVYCPAEAYVSTRAKLAVTVHCAGWFEPNQDPLDDTLNPDSARRMAPRFRLFRRHADVVFTVSEFLRQRLKALIGIPLSRSVVVGNGVEDHFYTPGPAHAGAAQQIAGRPYLLVVGAMTPHRGVWAVLALAEELRRRGSPLVIAVAGGTAEPFRSKAAEHPNIIQLGYVGVYEGLPGLMRDSIALLLLSHYETFGIPAAEAMAAGTPAVVSHHAALPEVVGDAGLVVDPDRTRDLADAVERLHAEPAARAELVARGRVRAEQYRWDACGERLVRAFRERS